MIRPGATSICAYSMRNTMSAGRAGEPLAFGLSEASSPAVAMPETNARRVTRPFRAEFWEDNSIFDPAIFTLGLTHKLNANIQFLLHELETELHLSRVFFTAAEHIEAPAAWPSKGVLCEA